MAVRPGDCWPVDSAPMHPPLLDDHNSRPCDVEKLRQIFQEHSARLIRFLKRLNADQPHIAEDLLQETMIRAWLHVQELPADEDHIRSWLFAVARNVSVDEARRRRRRPRESDVEKAVENYATTADPMRVVIATESMLEAYRNLNPDRRKAFEEIYLNSGSALDAASRLSVPEGTAKSRAFYAMQSIRSAIMSK